VRNEVQYVLEGMSKQKAQSLKAFKAPISEQQERGTDENTNYDDLDFSGWDF